ncbi:hypothetical protein [Streptomyces cellostaticus]|nr:hypothetical protein [Streptomyces cellostaticus]GHI04323.1 hypothetical protein Scel_26440 [Streptomyces cellostaticus]
MPSGQEAVKEKGAQRTAALADVCRPVDGTTPPGGHLNDPGHWV